MANMNMLNLISIDKTNGKIVNSNASNPIVYDSNQQNQINVIKIKDLSKDKEKFTINDHSFISNFTSDNFTIDNNETVNSYFTNSQQDIKTNSGPLMASNKYLTNDRNQQFFNHNAISASTTTYNSNLNFNIKHQQRSVQYESAIENNTNNGSDLISIDSIRYHI